MLTNFASTYCDSLLVNYPTPQCPTLKAHLSLACKHFSAPKHDFLHLKMNCLGFLHPRFRQKVPFSSAWTLPTPIYFVLGTKKEMKWNEKAVCRICVVNFSASKWPTYVKAWSVIQCTQRLHTIYLIQRGEGRS